MRFFATRLRQLRERRNLSQKDLAGLLKVQVALVSRYERGLIVPSAATMVELARILQVTTDELLLGGASHAEPPAVRHPMLLHLFQKLDSEIESRKDLDAIVSLLEAFLAKRRMQKVLSA